MTIRAIRGSRIIGRIGVSLGMTAGRKRTGITSLASTEQPQSPPWISLAADGCSFLYAEKKVSNFLPTFSRNGEGCDGQDLHRLLMRPWSDHGLGSSSRPRTHEEAGACPGLDLT